MAKTIEAVNKRFGLNDELDLTDVHAMYMTCAFETAWNKRKRSPWCSAFSVDDFKVCYLKHWKLINLEIFF